MKGWKTWVGTLGYAICEGARRMFPEYEAIAVTLQNVVFLPLGVIGIAHKLDKVKQS